MSEKRYKGGMHQGFSTLVKAIEQLSNQKVELSSDDEKLDIKAIRRIEAHQASVELSRQREQRHREFVDDVHKQGRINPEYTFDKIVKDEANAHAYDVALSFCATLNMDLDKLTNPPFFLLQGGPGTGKSVLCNCIANEFLVKHFKEVLLCSYSEIKRNRAPSSSDTVYDVQEKNSHWEKYLTVDLLIIDGFCQNNENLTAFDKQVFAELLRYRKELKLPIVVTTPLSAESIHPKLGDDCFESIKEYSVFSACLFGLSRRQPIIISGHNLG